MTERPAGWRSRWTERTCLPYKTVMEADVSDHGQVVRVQRNLLATAERRLLTWLCGKLPRWITPDHLTSLGVVSAIAIFASYALSGLDSSFLWLAIAGYIFHWFGDSLDGSLARHRKIERPAYGYFIDHSCDGLSTLLILGGMGISPYIRVDVGLLAVAGYLLLAVHTFLLAKVSGKFCISQLGAGPTELRLVLIGMTLLMLWLGPDAGRIGPFSGFDFVVGGVGLVFIALFAVQTLRTGNKLLKEEMLR